MLEYSQKGKYYLKITKIWKLPKCPSTVERLNQLRYSLTMEYYATMKINELQPCIATWMNLRGGNAFCGVGKIQFLNLGTGPIVRSLY